MCVCGFLYMCIDVCLCVNVCLCSCTSSSSCCVASACSQLLRCSNREAPWADIYEEQFRHFVAALDESEVPDMVVLMAVEPSDVQPLWTARGASPLLKDRVKPGAQRIVGTVRLATDKVC